MSDPPPGMVLRSSQRVVVRKRQSPSTPKPLASGGLVARRKNMYGSCSDTSESIVIDTVNPCLSREENSPAPSPPPSPLSTVSSVSRDEGINCLCGDTSVRKHGSGSVQCASCMSWSHIRCYSLDDATAALDSFVFTCSSCEPPPRPKVNPPHAQASREAGVQTNSGVNTHEVNVVLKLKEEVSQLKESVKSLQLQLMLIKEEVSQIKAPPKSSSKQSRSRAPPSSSASTTRSAKTSNSKQSVASRVLPGGSVRYYIPSSDDARPGDPSQCSDSQRKSRNSQTSSAHSSSGSSFKIIWGVRFRLSELLVTEQILAVIGEKYSPQLHLKKTVQNSDNGRLNWWFTINASPSVLSVIERDWALIDPTTSWHLCASLKDRPRPSVRVPLRSPAVGHRPREILRVSVSPTSQRVIHLESAAAEGLANHQSCRTAPADHRRSSHKWMLPLQLRLLPLCSLPFIEFRLLRIPLVFLRSMTLPTFF